MRKPTSGSDRVRSVRADASANDSPSIDPSRRRFLFALGAGGASAAVSASAHAAAPETVDVSDAHDASYRVTAHVRDYYRSTKI